MWISFNYFFFYAEKSEALKSNSVFFSHSFIILLSLVLAYTAILIMVTQ